MKRAEPFGNMERQMKLWLTFTRGALTNMGWTLRI